MNTEKYITYSEEETIELGAKFAERLKPGDIIALEGSLGTGKTEFIKGICKFFEVQEIVTSPTFTIINQYTGKFEDEDINIYHIDLYRIKSKNEFDEIGLLDCLADENAIKVVEWADKANGILPDNIYRVKITSDNENENERIFEILIP